MIELKTEINLYIGLNLDRGFLMRPYLLYTETTTKSSSKVACRRERHKNSKAPFP